MEQLIGQYLESRKLAWSPATQRSEQYRLRSLSGVLDGDAEKLWTHLTDLKPYSRITAWTRAGSFWEWMIQTQNATGPNPYTLFRERNARLFKHVYQPKPPSITFEEAVKRIGQIKDSGARALALQILGSGSRWCEAIQSGDEVVGKGAKVRRVYKPGSSEEAYTGSYGSFRRALRQIGLKPHELRKLCATRLVAEGLKEADLLKVMGWNSMETAKFYLAPKRDEELKAIFSKIHKEMK